MNRLLGYVVVGLVMALVLAMTGCGFQNPIGRDTNETVPGESSAAEDATAVSNYIAQTTIVVDVSGNDNQVTIGDGNRPVVAITTTAAPAVDGEEE